MNSKTESFQHLFEQNQSESPNDVNKIKVSDLGSDLEKIAIDSDFERERSRKIRRLTYAGIATLGCSRAFFLDSRNPSKTKAFTWYVLLKSAF